MKNHSKDEYTTVIQAEVDTQEMKMVLIYKSKTLKAYWKHIPCKSLLPIAELWYFYLFLYDARHT